jgi:alkanesulfonate monooxygenase SsuD/methylene tetrahydromethanopterin reductase-like flavin-dependent oxidoreductase (luciferase family)
MKIGLLVKTANDRATNSTRAYQTIREVALQAEADGFDGIWICDHMLYRRAGEPTHGK